MRRAFVAFAIMGALSGLAWGVSVEANCWREADCEICNRRIFYNQEECNITTWICDNGDNGANETCIPY
jgi:hypothetical protein